MTPTRSDIFRYIIPALLGFVYFYLFVPSFIESQLNAIASTIGIALGFFFFGFLVDVALLPSVLLALKKLRTKKENNKKPLIVINQLVLNELDKFQDEEIKSFVQDSCDCHSIFDAYINETAEDNTISRLFFLFDIVHSMNNCIFVSFLALFLPLFAIFNPFLVTHSSLFSIFSVTLTLTNLLVYYSIVSIIIFLCSITRHFKCRQAEAYENILLMRSFDELKDYVHASIMGYSKYYQETRSKTKFK